MEQIIAEIGESLGLTRERVRQIETEALGKLNEAFGLAGRDCISMSDELRRVLGARG